MSTNPTQQEIIDALGQDLLDAVYAFEQHGQKATELVEKIDSFGPHPENPREAIAALGGIGNILDTVFERERLLSARNRALDAYLTARQLVEAPSGQTAETASV